MDVRGGWSIAAYRFASTRFVFCLNGDSMLKLTFHPRFRSQFRYRDLAKHTKDAAQEHQEHLALAVSTIVDMKKELASMTSLKKEVTALWNGQALVLSSRSR